MNIHFPNDQGEYEEQHTSIVIGSVGRSVTCRLIDASEGKKRGRWYAAGTGGRFGVGLIEAVHGGAIAVCLFYGSDVVYCTNDIK